MRKYPIGLPFFEKIRREGYVYVDKTSEVFRLVNVGKYYFMSRPPRFGKSLLLSTIEALFSGRQHLFKGLWIHDNWDWSQKNPVIRFNFASMSVHTLGLNAGLGGGLVENANRLGIKLPRTSCDQQLMALVKKAAHTRQVVVLIDDFDKPFARCQEACGQVATYRSPLEAFYSVFNELDPYIRFAFATGVRRFREMNIFSYLGNFRDITFSNPFGTIAGITQQELLHYFGPEIELLHMGNPDILNDLKEWYKGYTWDLTNWVYNPFSVLSFMAAPVFKSYWFTAGIPASLENRLKALGTFDMDIVRATAHSLAGLCSSSGESIPMLFQTGCLAIQHALIDNQLFALKCPNREVRKGLIDCCPPQRLENLGSLRDGLTNI